MHLDITIVYAGFTLIYSLNSAEQIRRYRRDEYRMEGGHMSRIKIFEDILKAVSVLVTALASAVKFIGMVVDLKTAKA